MGSRFDLPNGSEEFLSVAMSNDKILISQRNVGVFLYNFTLNATLEMNRLRFYDLSTSSCSVDIIEDGSLYVIGYPEYRNNLGAVGILKDNVWSTINGSSTGSRFGQSVSLSGNGNVLAVGSPHYSNIIATQNGMVSIYRWSSSEFLYETTLYGKTNIAYHQFGFAVDLSYDGSTIVIGSIETGDPGHTGLVVVYQYQNGGWNKFGSEIEGPSPSSQFGYSVAIDDNGERFVASAPYHSGNRGIVRRYRINRNLNSIERIGDDLQGYFEGDLFGYTVSLENGRKSLGVGSLGNSYIYNWNADESVWTLSKSYRSDATNDSFGKVVSLSSSADYFVTGANSYIKVTSYDPDLTNIALNMPASQSSNGASASFAVNGNTGGTLDDNLNCQYTNEESNPWWMLNLEGMLNHLY